MFNSYMLITFQWVVQTSLIQMQAELAQLPRLVIKDKINAKERSLYWTFRILQIFLILTLFVAAMIGVKPSRCTSQPQKYTSVAILAFLLVAILISYWQLSTTLKNQFNEAFTTHGPKLLSFVIGVELCLLSYTLLLILPLFQMTVTAGLIQTIVQQISIWSPILLYIWMVDANEDCFDCFNRSKDNTGGAQALSYFQTVDNNVDTEEENVRVAMLKILKHEFYEP